MDVKTIVFLAGLIPFENSEKRKNVLFIESKDPMRHQFRTKFIKIVDAVTKRRRFNKIIKTYKNCQCFVVFDSFAGGIYFKCTR